MRKGQLPKAYLRLDPNIDQVHPDPGAMVLLMCAANRQPVRGRFKTRELLDRVLGADLVARLVGWGDVVEQSDGSWCVDKWAIWQEGDMTVSQRMTRYRARVRAGAKAAEPSPAVTPPVTPTVTPGVTSPVTPPSPTSRQQDSKTARQIDGHSSSSSDDAGSADEDDDESSRSPARSVADLTCPRCKKRNTLRQSPPGKGRDHWFCGTQRGGCGFKYSLGDPAIAEQFGVREAAEEPEAPPGPRPARPDPPEANQAAAILWRDVLHRLGVNTASTYVRDTRGVALTAEVLQVWCPTEVHVSLIDRSWGEQLAEALKPRTLRLVHGGVGGNAA